MRKCGRVKGDRGFRRFGGNSNHASRRLLPWQLGQAQLLQETIVRVQRLLDCGGEDIGGDDLIQQAGKLRICKLAAVQFLELLAEVLLQRGAVGDVRSVGIFEAAEFFDERILDVPFTDDRTSGIRKLGGRSIWRKPFAR